MIKQQSPTTLGLLIAAAGAALIVAAAVQAAADQPFYQQTNLVTDTGVGGTIKEDRLVNPWGIVQPPGDAPLWINDNGTGFSTLYMGDGPVLPLAVVIPPPMGQPGPATPTGIVFNPTAANKTNNFGGDLFIFAAEDGTISGWQFSDGTEAMLRRDNSTFSTVYKGLAFGFSSGGAPMIYATDFRHARIDVFDANYVPMMLSAGDFNDPALPAGYAPFGIANVGGRLFVTYALQDSFKHDDVAGLHHGFVDEFTTDGVMLRRFASGGKLNSPWGIALAPDDFGRFSNKLLIGNFGNGHINAFDLGSGKNVGELHGPHGAIVIDGLWGLDFGNGSVAFKTPANTLYFTAGPDAETHGLFGRLDVLPNRD